MYRAMVHVVSPLIFLHSDPSEQSTAEIRRDYMKRQGNPPVIDAFVQTEPFLPDSPGDYRVWIEIAHGISSSFRLTSSASNYEFAKQSLDHLRHCFCSLLRGEGMEKRTPEGWKETFKYLTREGMV